jgi:hypothetical protein
VGSEPQRQPMRASNGPDNEERREAVIRFLNTHSAHEIDHLNGTLFDHLVRTELLLRRWGCSEVVSVAGLCHATYGTDGFPTSLLAVEERDQLEEVVGSDVEALVYLYASCDRGFVYPTLGHGQEIEFRDRFTGLTFVPTHSQLRGFIDLTLGNEFDVGFGDQDAGDPPAWLVAMFEHFEHLASEPVRDVFRRLVATGRR